MVPEGWLRTTLGDIAVVSSGSTPSRSRPEYWGGHIPWVTTSEVKYRPIVETREHVTALALDDVPLRVYPAGTILMAMYGQGVTRGRVAILGIDATINQACCAITLTGDAEPSYVSRILEFLYPKIRTLGHGGNQQNLNADIVRQIPMILPPQEEQQLILDVLVTWDRAIENLEYQIESKRERKRGLMQVLLTGKKRFKEYGAIPWRKVSLSQLGRVASGGTPSTSVPAYWNGEHAWCTPSEVTALGSRFIESTVRSTSGEGLRASAAELLPPGSLIVCTRATIGDCAINAIPMAMNQGFKAIVPRDDVDVEFLYYKIVHAKPALLRLANGSTFLEVSKRDFEGLEIEVPCLEEQRRIAAVLSTADSEIENLQKQLEAYSLQKRGLMQQLLTGKKRVKAEDPMAVPA